MNNIKMKEIPLMKKTPSQSHADLSCLAIPADANTIGTVFGGRLMELMDMTVAICARRHSHKRVATVKVESLHFHEPLRVGHVINVLAVMNRSFHTSMDITVTVTGEDTYKDQRFMAASGVFIVIGLDDENKPTPVPELVPESEEEKQRWEEAGRRRGQTGPYSV
jgi:acyl-CoA hydrolase